ncbi:MAG: SusC/RagA family TonB-linked outer membrane protein [Bacteroidota bacterium]
MKILSLFCALAYWIPVSAQTLPKPVTGTVINSQTRLPVEQCTVTGKVSGVATITNKQGWFSLPASPTDTLVISHIGYATKLQAVVTDGSQQPLLIQLTELNTELEAVTVNTGYQAVAKERATGSFVVLNNDLVNRRVSTNIIDRLQGVASGVAFNKSDSKGTDEISIRGRSTIFSNATALVVVDNFPYEGSLSNINPNDVESITILRDAAAASIWGARAANGVIVITTKKGRFNQKAVLDINSSFSVGTKPDVFYVPKMQTTDIIDIEKMLFDKGYYNSVLNNTTTYPAVSPVVEILQLRKTGAITQAEADQQVDALRGIDNRNDLTNLAYRPSTSQQYALNLSGGSQGVAYFVSGGYNRDLGSLAQVNERISLLSRTSFSPVANLQLNSSISFIQTNAAEGIYPGSASVYPYERMADDNGNSLPATRSYRKGFISQLQQRGFQDWSSYSLADAKLTDNTTKTNEIRLALGGRYQLVKWASLEFNYQYQQQAAATRNYQAQQSYFVRDLVNQYTQFNATTGLVTARPIPLGGILDKAHSESVANNGRLQVNINHTSGRHRLSVIAGGEIRQVRSESNSLRLYGYDPLIITNKTVNYDSSYLTFPFGSRSKIPNAPSAGTEFLDRYLSGFANGSYTYNNRYTISGSVRKDASNYFGVAANQRAVPLWSAGAKWDIDKESFYKLRWLPLLSLRMTYGYNGNINKSLTAYTTALSGTNNFNLPNALIINPPNASLRWERVQMVNMAIDFRSRNNRVEGSLEWYVKKGLDLIGSGGIDPTSGVARFTGNVASMRGTGGDLQLNTLNTTGAVAWRTNILVSYNTDKVTDYQLVPTAGAMVSGATISPLVGSPVFSVYSFNWAGLDPATGDPQGYINKQVSKDYTKLVAPALTDIQYHGSARPLFFGSFRNSISWAGLSLSANITYKLGYYFRRKGLEYNTLFASLTTHSDYYKRWQKPGDELTTQVPSLIYPVVNNRDVFYSRSEAMTEKGDHIRLQDIGLNYNMDKFVQKRLHFRHLEAYVYINNCGILWRANKNGIDPDHQQVAPPGIHYSFGLRAGF